MAITPHAAGAWAATDAAATATVTLPTHSTGDLLIVVGAQKAATIANSNPTITTPATGWTRFLDGASGTNNSGNGTGSVHMSVFWKVAASASETSPVITWGDNSSPAVVNAWSFTSATGLFYTPVGVIKVGNVATSISITHDSNPGITTADLGLVILTMGDNNALTVPSWTATTAVLAAVVEYPATAISSATGNDMAADAGYRIVSSGTATAAPVQTHTSAAADENIGAFVRLRELPNSSGAAELASATGTARAPSANPGTAAGVVSATGTALQPTTISGAYPNAELTSATGTAQQAAVRVEPAAGLGSATGTAFDTTTISGAYPPAGLSSATATAHQPAARGEALAVAGAGSATGTAHEPTTISGAFPVAGVGAATGTAHAPTANPASKAGIASALAAAYDPTGAVAAILGLASAVGTAWNPTVTVFQPGAPVDAPAGVGVATGTAWDASVTVVVPTTGGRRGVRRGRPGQRKPPDLPLRPIMFTIPEAFAHPGVAQAVAAAHGAMIEWNDDETVLLFLLEGLL